MGRYGARPIIFVLNNLWYMIERALEISPDQKYKGACYIEIIAGRTDFTLGLKVMNSRLMQMYGFDDEREMP